MDKITRIHIAKVPYNASVAAQAKLEKYLRDIREHVAADVAEETMTDIEVRITEILSDRNVQRDGVITLQDVEAVQEQLGLPEQFTDEESKHPAGTSTGAKKLLRDMDNALLGGVAAGLGAYFDVDPVIIRIIFVILIFFSGLGIILYVLLWVLVPAAKTSSDKLLMRGQPATVAAMQRYRNTAQQTMAGIKLRSICKALFVVCRFLLTAGAAVWILCLLTAIGLASAVLYTKPIAQVYSAYHLNYVVFGLLWLLVMTVIGLIVVVLLRLWSQRSKSLAMVFISLIAIFVMTIAGIATSAPFLVNHYREVYGGDKLAVAIPVHADDMLAPTGLTVSGDSELDVSYVVTNQPVHATYQAYPAMGHPQLTITEKSQTIVIQAQHLSQVMPDCMFNWCKNVYLPVRVTVYGPSLQKFTATNGGELHLGDYSQSSMAIVAGNGSSVMVDSSDSTTLSLTATNGASISSGDMTAQTAIVTVDTTSSIDGPIISTLDATLPNECDQPVLMLPQSPTASTVNAQQTTLDALDQNACVQIDDSAPAMPPLPVKVRQ